MMAFHFKGLSILYMVFWIFVVSYAAAITLYQDTYAPPYKGLDYSRKTVILLAHFNSVASAVGFLFTNCEITHIIPSVLFILPFIIVNLVFGSIGLRVASELQLPSQRSLLMDSIADLTTGRGHLAWLHAAQLEGKCCGIYSYLDYWTYFNTKNRDDISHRIPQSCCNDKTDAQCLQNLRSLEGKLSDSPSKSVHQMYKDLHCKNHSKFMVYNDTQAKPSFNLAGNVSNIIYTCGCYLRLHGNLHSLHHTLYTFFIGIVVGTVAVTYVFVKHWFRTRRLRTSREDEQTPKKVHSLKSTAESRRGAHAHIRASTFRPT